MDGEVVKNYMNGLEYRRNGLFLISESEILGPNMRIVDDGSELYKIVRNFIEQKDYKGLEKFFGIKIRRDKLFLENDEIMVIRQKSREPYLPRETAKIGRWEIEFELFDKYYAFRPHSTIVMKKTSGYIDELFYFQGNIKLKIDPDDFPQPIDDMVFREKVYEELFQPLGIPPDAKIEMSHIRYKNSITVEVTGSVGDKTVETLAYMKIMPGLNGPRVEKIRFFGWPFEEGAYSFDVPIGKRVDLGERSIKRVRKKLKNVSKIFGPPAWVKVPEDWKIKYYHYLGSITYSKDNASITFYRNKTVELKIGFTTRVLNNNIYALLENFFKDPAIIDIL